MLTFIVQTNIDLVSYLQRLALLQIMHIRLTRCSILR